jgi:hypothetical protein
MRPQLLIVLALSLALPAWASDCSSLVASVCEKSDTDNSTGAKVLSVPTTVTSFVVGDRFPYETRSLLMDPARYNLRPSDGTWRYYAMSGVIYRVQTDTGLVLEVIRNRHTAQLR